jgi:serine/threonine protein kinase
MDFGIARSADAKATHLGSVIGTPAYMAPEQAEGRKVDARADIYAVGLILYEILTGRRAFTGDTPVSIAVKHIRETPPRPRDLESAIPPDLEAVIVKCLEKDLRKRFQSVREMEEALAAPGIVPQPRLTSVRRLAVTSAALLATVLGAFWLGWKMKPTFLQPAQEAGVVSAPQNAPSGDQQKAAESREPAGGPQQPVGSPATATDPAKKGPTPSKPRGDIARYEFSLSEATEFTEVGPISIRLNKADPKRQMYTVTVQVRENRMELRDRALLEPVSFYHDQSRRMLELVVSKIEERNVKGYLMAPKSVKGSNPAPVQPPSKR